MGGKNSKPFPLMYASINTDCKPCLEKSPEYTQFLATLDKSYKNIAEESKILSATISGLHQKYRKNKTLDEKDRLALKTAAHALKENQEKVLSFILARYKKYEKAITPYLKCYKKDCPKGYKIMIKLVEDYIMGVLSFTKYPMRKSTTQEMKVYTAIYVGLGGNLAKLQKDGDAANKALRRIG